MICTHTHCINKHACRHADVRTLHTCHYNTSHYIADMLYVAYKCIQYSCDIHYIACITLHYIMYITYTTCFLLASHGILWCHIMSFVLLSFVWLYYLVFRSFIHRYKMCIPSLICHSTTLTSTSIWLHWINYH